MRSWLGAAFGALLVLVAVGLAVGTLRDGSEEDASAPTTEKRAKRPAAPPGKAAPRPNRQKVRRGKGERPDRPAPGTGALLGIADQKAATFSDPRFAKLGVVRSRLNTPWNAVFTEPERLGAWLDAARAAGIEPLIAFHHARGDLCPADPCTLPSVRQYTRAVRAFHRRWPWVRLLQPWNEANSATQPTAKNPERAAAYYNALNDVCPDCIVTGADVLDSSNMTDWLRRFRSAIDGPQPRLWGLHNYTDTNRFRSAGTKAMLRLVKGQLWLTETGGIVAFTTATGKVALRHDEKRARRAIDFLFRLARTSRRITRVYVYQWRKTAPGDRFDAGLVAPDNNGRPSLQALRRQLGLPPASIGAP